MHEFPYSVSVINYSITLLTSVPIRKKQWIFTRCKCLSQHFVQFMCSFWEKTKIMAFKIQPIETFYKICVLMNWSLYLETSFNENSRKDNLRKSTLETPPRMLSYLQLTDKITFILNRRKKKVSYRVWQ